MLSQPSSRLGPEDFFNMGMIIILNYEIGEVGDFSCQSEFRNEEDLRASYEIRNAIRLSPFILLALTHRVALDLALVISFSLYFSLRST